MLPAFIWLKIETNDGLLRTL